MGYEENYEFYLQNVNEEERNLLKNYSLLEKRESFGSRLSFGTGGIRELMGLGSSKLNTYTIKQITYGLVLYYQTNKFENGVAISYDNRNHSFEFANLVSRVFSSYQIKSYIYENLRPTPMLSFLVLNKKCDLGIMITASHNPKEYNGYKVYNKNGAQLNLKESDDLVSFIDTVLNPFTILDSDSSLVNVIGEGFDLIYLEKLKNVPLNKIDTVNEKIVYSPLHGTGGTVIPKMVKSFGYNILPVEKEIYPDGNFTNVINPNPENKLAFINSIAYANEINSNFIVVTDPDADRLGVLYREKGKDFIYLTGNQTASIELYYILNNKKYLKPGFVCTTNVTTPLIEIMAKSYNHFVKITPTGFKFIGEFSKEIENKYEYVFGCEESYGSLIQDYVRDKDAIQAVLLLSEIYYYLTSKNLTFSDYLNEIYSRYGYFIEYTENISFVGLESKQKMKTFMNYFRENNVFTNLLEIEDQLEGYKIRNNVREKSTLEKLDCIKYIFQDDSFIVLRPSGTEPKVKIYFSVKGVKFENATERLNELKNFVLNELKTKGLI
jgi:phosphoglucomutase